VALYRGVRDPELLRDHGVFIAEGRMVVQRLLAHARFGARSVLVTPAALEALQNLLVSSEAEILVVDQDVMDAITAFNVHRGCLAIAERPPAITVETLLQHPGPLLILENVGNPDNVGGAFRNAAALGASAVVLSPGCSDPLYRKAIRTSMGATLTLPFAVADAWPDALDAVLASGWRLVGLTPSAELDVRSAFSGIAASRAALLLGHEGEGLTADALRRATVEARIPMAPGADSVNVATAAAVALYALQSG
jgi:tRNA G18 (ribose-2'-O)-methylase SpoU